MSDINLSTEIVCYKKPWQTLIVDGLVSVDDYDYYSNAIVSSNITFVHLASRTIIASSKLNYFSARIDYVNEPFFEKNNDLYEIIDVSEFVNFPDTKLLCRLKSDENRIWKKKEDYYIINLDYFPRETSRQARVIEILAELENPLPPQSLTDKEIESIQELLSK